MTRAKTLVIIGAGGHAKVVAATAVAAGWTPVAVFDDDPALLGISVLGVPVRGTTADARHFGADGALLAVGDNGVRRNLEGDLDLPWTTLAHPYSCVHPSVRLGVGTVVFAGAVIQPDVVIGRHAIVNTGATIDHDCAIGDFAHLAPGVNLAGNVTVGVGALMGVGTKAIPGVAVGDWAVIGAGSVVVHDVPSRVTARGVPARWTG